MLSTRRLRSANEISTGSTIRLWIALTKWSAHPTRLSKSWTRVSSRRRRLPPPAEEAFRDVARLLPPEALDDSGAQLPPMMRASLEAAKQLDLVSACASLAENLDSGEAEGLGQCVVGGDSSPGRDGAVQAGTEVGANVGRQAWEGNGLHLQDVEHTGNAANWPAEGAASAKGRTRASAR